MISWGISFLLHGLIILSIFIYPKQEIPNLPKINITPISETQFNQIVKTNKSKNQVKPNQKKYLSDKTNNTDKNQVAGKSPKSNDSKIKTTSIKQDGPYKSDDKKGTGISASDDYIEGATIGPMTILNTQEFKYHNYYERIKERINIIWKPLIRTAILKVKQESKLEVKLYITKLEIVLNESGEILIIAIRQLSGFDRFDRVAISSFNQAAPIPGPPKELIKDNKFTLYWDFVVNVQESGIIDYRGGYVK